MRHGEIEYLVPHRFVCERVHALDYRLQRISDFGNVFQRRLVDSANADDAFIGFHFDDDGVVGAPRRTRRPVDLVEFHGHRMGFYAGDFHDGLPFVRDA